MVKKNSKNLNKIKGIKPTLKTDRDVAMDFAVKVYKKFDKMIKAIVLFGSTTKENATSTSDIDIVIVIDDASIRWDLELIAWYREELAKIVNSNEHSKDIHITTVKITTWWSDLLKGDPTIMNMIRYGEALIDIGGFFNPMKALLSQGRIKSTPEAIYLALNRAPEHLRRSQIAEMSAIEGVFWSMVDSGQAALMSAGVMPPSPEHVSILLKETFVDTKKTKIDYVIWMRDIYIFHRKVSHGDLNIVKGSEIQVWQERAEQFIAEMVRLVNNEITKK